MWGTIQDVTARFRLLLEQAAVKLGSQAALAEHLGIDPARISRLKTSRTGAGRLSVENCLKLAGILDEWPGDVLRAAGHPSTAVVFENLCGPQRRQDLLKSSEWQLLRLWRQLPDHRRAAFLNLLKTEGGPGVAPTRRRQFPEAVGGTARDK